MAAGYSGTPLVRKLGIGSGHHIAVVNEPAEFRPLLLELPADVTFRADVGEAPDMVIAFYVQRDHLQADIDGLARAVFPDRAIWLAWPKMRSGVATDLTENVVRAAVLATSLVDVKVCAISEIWSGLKVVWRKEHRR